MSTGEQLAWLAFIAAHAPLGLWMHSQSLVAFAQAAVIFGAGLWWALTRRPVLVAYAGAYIVGSEVLWRMITDALWWESGKYALIVLFSGALLNGSGIRSLIAPGLCFAMLLPSTWLTVQEFGSSSLRGVLSFNLSGPLSLAVSAAFFSTLKLSPAKTLRLFLTLVAPVVAIGTIVVFNIAAVEKIQFTFESNPATSGNFGPNQVSLALSLGALASLWCLLEHGVIWPVRLVLFGLMVWLGGQSTLTFSRGGPLGFVGAASVALFFLMGNAEARRRLMVAVPLLVLLGSYVIWPALVEFTGGALATRYQETGLTHRDELGNADLKLWSENPILGVGPGLSPRHHQNNAVAHTEFTRIVAEHGLFGALGIALLMVTGVRSVLRAASARERGLVASALTWGVLFMLNSAMRTVGPSFMCGLSFALFAPVLTRNQQPQAAAGRIIVRRRHTRDRPEPSAA